MRKLRLLIIALASVCVLTLGVLALANRNVVTAPADDDIIIKGGSLEVDCGKNQGKDCFGDNTPGKSKAKHKDTNKHITEIVVNNSNGGVLYSSSFDKDHQPWITITYK